MATQHFSNDLADVFVTYCRNNHPEWLSAHLPIARLHSCVSFCSDVSADADHSTMTISNKGLHRLPEKQLVMYGKLIHASTSCNDHTWFQLQDKSGTIRCQVSHDVARLVRHYVICTRWNYIISESAAVHLEISGATQLSTGEPPPSSSNHVLVLSVTSAQHLHQYRELLSTQHVNVQARLVAISEIIRIHEDEVVMSKLYDEATSATITLIIKDHHFLYWRHILAVGEVYVFLNVKPTTLYKNEEMEQKIYTVTHDSDVRPCVTASIRRLSLNDWIRLFGRRPITEGDIPEFDEQSPISVSFPTEDNFTYQGTISSCDRARYGIYGVDDVKTLYLLHLPPVALSQCLRVGACIRVVHIHAVSEGTTSVKLYGCAHSHVEILQFSPYENASMKMDLSPAPILSLIGRHGLHMLHVDWLLNAEEVLRAKFSPKNSCGHSSVTERLLSAVLDTLPGRSQNAAVQLPRQPTNPLLEFINYDVEACAESAIKMEPMTKLHFATMREVVEFSKSLERESNSQNVITNDPAATHWKYSITHSRDLSPNLVVIGVLKADKTTSNLQLADRTAAIQCVTAPITTRGHCCTHTCLQRPAVGLTYFCPHASISSIGDIVRVDSFDIIQESLERAAPLRYLVFSMCNVVCLSNGARTTDRRSVLSPTENVLSTRKSSRENSVSACNNPPPMKCNIPVESAEMSENMENSAESKPSKLLNQSEDFLLSSLNLSPMSFPLIVQLFAVFAKTSPTIRARTNDSPQLSFVASTRFVGNPMKLTSSDDPMHFSHENISSKSQPHVALFFCEDAVRWYQFLQPGGVYGLVRTCSDDVAAILGRRPWSALERAIMAPNVRQCVRVDKRFELIPAEMITKHLRKQSAVLEEYSKSDLVLNVRDVCVNRSSSEVVSLKGRIMSRTPIDDGSQSTTSDESHRKMERHKQKLGISIPGDGRLRLVLRDLDTNDELLVYMTLGDLSYPLGLLPGVVVTLGGVNVHPPSQRGNFYCYYTCASSYHVTCANQLESSMPITTLTSTSVDLTTHLRICQLLHPLPCGHPAAVTGSIRCACFVQRVLRVCLRAVCHECAQPRRLCRCAASGMVFVANASFMIDDGSGSALVYCEGRSVQQLLNLSDTQWTALELKMDSDAHSYNSRRPETNSSDVEILLRYLCVSESVLRHVILTAKYNSNLSRRVARMDLEDYEIKTMDVERRELKTRLLPLITLQLVSMETVDHLYYSNALLAKEASLQ